MQAPQLNETRFARYEILRELAGGTYTTVFEAMHTDPKLRDRCVALKILRRNHDSQRFMQAAQINAALSHPCIPALYEVGDARGRLYCVRQFVEGDDLQNGIGYGRNFAEVARVIADVAGALDHAHGRGVLHGYVHPRHILLAHDSAAWLIGFGEHSPADVVAEGNPLHLAPEQLAGHTATPATDVFALSETAAWLLCGRHPSCGFATAQLQSAKRQSRTGRGVQLVWAGIPPAVQRVLRQGMAPDPADRHATAGEFAAALSSAG
ncbi:MAG TPA: serine/threonine-protein kinase [Gemmataceae bacterium]|nr:serine/threonine-protein kinase [Gemmataceae bacterium]